MRLKKITTRDGIHTGYYFFCPACEDTHSVGIDWIISGTEDLPTIRYTVHYNKKQKCCSKVTKGYIEYLDTSEHHLKGKTIELPDI